jgi:hypothetical protein
MAMDISKATNLKLDKMEYLIEKLFRGSDVPTIPSPQLEVGPRSFPDPDATIVPSSSQITNSSSSQKKRRILSDDDMLTDSS